MMQPAFRTAMACLLLFCAPAHAQDNPAQGKAWTPAQYCASIEECEVLDVKWEASPTYGKCFVKYCDGGKFYNRWTWCRLPDQPAMAPAADPASALTGGSYPSQVFRRGPYKEDSGPQMIATPAPLECPGIRILNNM